MNGNTLVFIQDTINLKLLKADKIVQPEQGKNYNYEWVLPVQEINKANSDSLVTLFFEEAGEYNITLKQPNGLMKQNQLVLIIKNP